MIKRTGKFIGWLFDRLSVVAGAWIGSQIPQFFQQYIQRLGGHIDELSYLKSQLNLYAGRSHKNLAQYTQKFLSEPDADFHLQGQFIQDIISRLDRLSNSLHSLLNSTDWNRLYRFFSEMDTETAKATLRSFQPGFSMSLEGVVYTGLGIILGYALYRGSVHIFRGLFRALRRLF